MTGFARARTVAGRWSAAVAMAAALGGCATLDRGLDDEIAVMSEPPGAIVTSSAGVGCASTPCTLTVRRNAVFTVTVAKPGYASRTVDVTTRISGAGAALATENIATAGLGLTIDAATGGALEHVPAAIDVTLASVAAPAPKSGRPHPKA